MAPFDSPGRDCHSRHTIRAITSEPRATRHVLVREPLIEHAAQRWSLAHGESCGAQRNHYLQLDMSCHFHLGYQLKQRPTGRNQREGLYAIAGLDLKMRGTGPSPGFQKRMLLYRTTGSAGSLFALSSPEEAISSAPVAFSSSFARLISSDVSQ